jgi:ATP-binding cassette, subfamily B, bacterial
VSTGAEEDDLPSLLASWRALFGVAWRASRSGALVATFGWFLTTLVAGPMMALALQRVLGGRGFGAPLWTVLLVVAVITPEVLLSLVDHMREIVLRRAEQRISMEIIRAALRPRGIEHLENPRFADRVTFLRDEAERVAGVFGMAAGQAGLLLGFALSASVLAGVSWWLVLPVLGSLALGAAQLRASRWAMTVHQGALPDQRLAERLVRLSADPVTAADVRMLGMGSWLLRRHDRATAAVGRSLLRSERRNVVFAGVFGAVQAVMLVSGLGLLLWLAGRGRASAGDVVLGVALLQTVLESARQLTTQTTFIVQLSFAARRYLWLLRYPDPVRQAASPRPVPARLAGGIRFDAVSFAYPFTDREVLREVSFDVPAGSTLALVGDNGAGKSTVIKLLCRYYDPTGGEITVDGVDLRELDLEAWRAGTTVGFQDFVRFEFPAVESIGLSQLDAIEDAGRPRAGRTELVAAAARAGNAAPFLERLPDGYDTQLGRQFGGESLSTGQWQRVAMSRTFFRPEPVLVLLDEPTAALDPRAEHEVFRRFAERTAEARARGAVTVLVSHRFSTVDMADQIVVFEGGRVAEVGDHASLLAAGGIYRRSFDTQARWYTDGGQP